jgi:hypothetical protein
MKTLSMPEIIAETKAIYADDKENFGYNTENQSCEYWTPDGKMCGIGRCLLNPQDFIPFGSLVEHCEDDGLAIYRMTNSYTDRLWSDEFLKPEYRGHPPQFWQAIQRWHDMKAELYYAKKTCFSTSRQVNNFSAAEEKLEQFNQ